jgi:hypothetical protein
LAATVSALRSRLGQSVNLTSRDPRPRDG